MHNKLLTDLETLIAMPAQIQHYEQIEKRQTYEMRHDKYILY